MLQLLPVTEHAKAFPLFDRLVKNQPMCTSVLEGVYPGQVYVDDMVRPRTALLVTHIESEAYGAWCFLAGDPHNPAFTRALNAAIYARQVIAENTPVLLITCDPDDWGGQMAAVLAPHPPIWFPRYHFVSRRAGFNWRAALPQGFSVEPMDEGLRSIPGLELPDDVAATLAKWQAITDPRFADFGFVALDRTSPQPTIASWATVDFIAKGAGDLGFFTQPEYRHRGLGTIAVAAAFEHGFASGLQQINWTCDAENQGSTRTAEKLGLEKIEDYNQAVLLMDEKKHLALFQQR